MRHGTGINIAREHAYECICAELHDVTKEKWGATKMRAAKDTDEPAILFSGWPRF
jgi:hypothetical protein